MKKFTFTLETVHKVRELRKERESLILGELQSEAEFAEMRSAETERTRLEAIENYTTRLRSGEQLNPMEMELNSNHLVALKRRRIEEEKAVEQKKQACERQGETVIAAMRETQVTEKLCEVQRERHQLEALRQEQNDIDELVSAKFARQMGQAR